MDIVPVIELKTGKSIRPLQVKEELRYFRTDDPLKIAKHFRDEGATRLMLRDIDGERVGSPQNRDVVRDIVRRLGIAVTYAGGVRNASTAERAFTWGVERVVVEVQATLDPAIVPLLEALKDTLALEIRDVQGRMKKPTVEVEQWVSVDAYLGRIRLEQPWSRFLFVPSKPSGDPAAVSVAQVLNFFGRAGKPVDLFGHFTDCEELEELAGTGIDSVCICGPLYDGTISLTEAIAAGKGDSVNTRWQSSGLAGADGLLAPAAYQKPTSHTHPTPAVRPQQHIPATGASLPLPPPPKRPAIPPAARPPTPQPPSKDPPWPWKKPK